MSGLEDGGFKKMKIKNNWFDSIAYICFAIGTLGLAAVLRVIITTAIKKAFEEE